ncbi:MAG TPA: DNA internalization-related competence protein ComEC/Rec2 [Candidatus Nitrosotenuis sp.]|nr:DNA internalization-related competence protein ComEC/Rec2 [Candidatus Nitrosotenuis sp.]
MVAALSAGILLANGTGLRTLAPAVWLAGVLTSLLVGFGLFRRVNLGGTWSAALSAWLFLGGLAAVGEIQSLPSNHITKVVASGAIDAREPLRWRGQLRSDPARLPWGVRYELDLAGVEFAGRDLPVSGGLRATYYFNEQHNESVPPLRAGDEVELLLRARPPRNFQNPGAFDFRAHLARQEIHLIGNLRSMELLRRLPAQPLSVGHRLARLRGELLERLQSLYGENRDRTAILRAMLLGDSNFLDREVSDAFQKTAVYHVLVISGMHVAAMAAFLWWMGRRVRLPYPVLAVLVLLAILAFVGIVEDSPPVERAAWMAALVMGARLLYRQVAVLNTVAFAALLLLIAKPSNLTDSSFQLSFLAAGIIAGVGVPFAERSVEPWRRALTHLRDASRDAAHAPRAAQFRLDVRDAAAWLSARLPRQIAQFADRMLAIPLRGAIRAWEVILVSLAIQFCLLPVMAHYFHRVSISGALANLPAAILSAVVIPVGFLSLIFGGLWTSLANALAWVTSLFAGWLLSCVQWFSNWTFGAYRIPGAPAWTLSLFLALLACFALASVARSWRWQVVSGTPLALFTMLVAVHPFAPDLRAGALEVTVLDVGQGDSIFISFPDGRTMLIDGGGATGQRSIGGVRTGMDIGEQVVSAFLWERGLKKLDFVALTHAHQDHLDGLHAVLTNFQVGELWVGRESRRESFRTLLAAAAARGTRIIYRKRGDEIQVGEVRARVLWPEDTYASSDSSNNDSLVLKMDWRGRAIVLPGDIEKPVELTLVAQGEPLRADLLKVSHHGSRTSTSAEWITAVNPRLAVMSFGEANPFGHPHPELLQRLATFERLLLRTDRDGAVTVLIDPHSLRVTTFAAGVPE